MHEGHELTKKRRRKKGKNLRRDECGVVEGSWASENSVDEGKMNKREC